MSQTETTSTTPTTEARTSTHHSRAESYKLAELVRTTYAAKAASDAEFARQASTELGFPVNAGQVASAREIFGLQNGRKERAQAARDEQAKELDALRSENARLKAENDDLRAKADGLAAVAAA